VGFVLSEVAGVWRRANEILVNGANFNPFVSMSQISCSAAQNCAAIGTFINANNTDEALLVDQVNGIWSSNIQLTLPKNSSPFTGVNTGEITCVRNGSCSIFGTYNTATGAVEGVSAREERGVWSKSTEIVLPANSATNPHVFLYEFQGIACSSSLNCSVGGQYQNTGGQYEGFLANEVNGTWRRASELLLPTGAVSVGKNGGVVALSCPAKGDCRAGAAYLDAQGRYQALVVNESNGVWQRGTSVLLPAGASTVGVDGGVYALSCSSPKSCTAIGSYLKNPSLYEGFTLRN
jgi:hypothetical protein